MLPHRTLVSAALVAVAMTMAPAASRGQIAAEDMLPDVIVNGDALGEIRIDPFTMPGHRLLRLTAATPNIGRGRLEIRTDPSTATDPTVPSPVVQRIYRSDGTFWDRPAGSETFDADHGHVHFDTWAQYRLRAVSPDGSAGAILAQSNKTSFCLLDLVPFDLTNPFFVYPGHFVGCGFLVQGISPGWADVYDLEIPNQWIDITAVADGEYWLEAEVDPDNRVLEIDETNNVARIRVQTGAPPPAVPDAYEENDDIAEIDERPAGAPNSPNLGPLLGRRRIDGLTMEDGSDLFKFHLGAMPSGGSVRIESPYLGSDLDLALLDGQGNVLDTSASVTNFEQVSLAGAAPGDYYAWVLGGAAPNPGYRLIIDPGMSPPPSIVLSAPGAAGVFIERDFEALPVAWTVSDPIGAPTTVALSIDRDQVVDKQTLRLPGYQHIDGSAGGANVLTEGFGLGTWFLHAEVTDGQGLGSAWAPGPFVIYVKGDVNFDGVVDGADWNLVRRALDRGGIPATLPPGWDAILDLDRDGAVRADDIRALRRLTATPCAPRPR